MIDPLGKIASSILTPCNIRLDNSFEPDLFFDGDRFMKYLGETFDSFDVMTYSISKSMTAPLKKINRLIHGLPYKCLGTRPKEKKLIVNNHVKLFVCYSIAINEPVIYLGSQNLTHGTNLNIMYRVKQDHVQPLVNFFNTLWNSI